MSKDKKKTKEDFSSFSIPYPYLTSAMDQFYGVHAGNSQQHVLLQNHGNSKEQFRKVSPQHKKKMKVLVATFWDYPHVGGLSNYITSIKRGLEELGHSVDVVAPNDFDEKGAGDLKRQVSRYLKEYYLKRYGYFSEIILKNSRGLYAYELMLRKMNLQQYDIFHAQDLFTANILGSLNASYRKPLLFTPHGHFTQSRLKFNKLESGSVEETYYRAIERRAIQNASKMIILCNSFRPPLRELGAEDEKMTTVYTGIEFKEETKKKKTKIPKEKLVITCVSRLAPRKGHKYLFEALALIRNEIANTEIVIAGDGEMREQLENQVRSLQLNNVQFLGTRDDIPQLLSKSDIFVHPTINDNLPICVIEAMFGRQAIIASNCGGIPEVIQDGHTGFITEPGDSQAIADKLLLLLNNPTLRETLAENAQQFAQTHLTVTNMTRKIEDVYQSLL